MNDEKFKVTIRLENEMGSVDISYSGTTRDSLLKNPLTAALLQIFEDSIPHEDPADVELKS